MPRSSRELQQFPPVVTRLSWAVLVVGVVAVVGTLALRGLEVTAPPWVHVVLGIGFVVADRLRVNLDVRDHSVTVTLSEVVLVAALFLVSPGEALVLRLAGGLPTRLSNHPDKRRTNIGTMCVTSALVVAVASAGPLDLTDPAAWGRTLLAMGLGSLSDMTMLGTIIRLATGSTARLGRTVMVSMFVFAVATSASTLSVLLLSSLDPLAALLGLVPVAVIVLGHRQLVRQRHEADRLRTLYELASGIGDATDFEPLIADVVTETRALLRCHEVELVVHAGGQDGADLVLRVDELGRLHATRSDGGALVPATDTWAATPAVGTGHLEPDAVAVPVGAGAELVGHLAAAGRPEGREPFGPADRTALRALADRVGAVVGRGRMRGRLDTAEEATRYLELHDPLTGLGNRRWFVGEVGRLADEHGSVVVALANLRGFRRVNDVLGQAAGDLLLVEVADTLRSRLPMHASVARLASDEFAMAVPGTDASAVELALSQHVSSQLRGQEVTLPFAAGVAVLPLDVHEATQLLRAADLAMTAARQRRQGGVVRYDVADGEAVTRRARLSADLQAALAADALDVHVQPLVDVATRRTVGVEVLARWQHPELGPIRPDEFVAIAEESGQIGLLTRFVLDRATRAAATWRDQGLELEVAVNVSALDLEGPDLLDDVRHVLAASGVPPRQLVLEVTETSMMADLSRGAVMLAELAELGVGLAIDDFGTGHSSLAYVQELPVSEIKIDRVFVADLLDNEQSELIVRTVVELAARRGLVVVAEGVEDETTLQRLAELGVDRVQGWHTGRPAPVAELVVAERPGAEI